MSKIMTSKFVIYLLLSCSSSAFSASPCMLVSLFFNVSLVADKIKKNKAQFTHQQLNTTQQIRPIMFRLLRINRLLFEITFVLIGSARACLRNYKSLSGEVGGIQECTFQLIIDNIIPHCRFIAKTSVYCTTIYKFLSTFPPCFKETEEKKETPELMVCAPQRHKPI